MKIVVETLAFLLRVFIPRTATTPAQHVVPKTRQTLSVFEQQIIVVSLPGPLGTTTATIYDRANTKAFCPSRRMQVQMEKKEKRRANARSTPFCFSSFQPFFSSNINVPNEPVTTTEAHKRKNTPTKCLPRASGPLSNCSLNSQFHYQNSNTL